MPRPLSSSPRTIRPPPESEREGGLQSAEGTAAYRTIGLLIYTDLNQLVLRVELPITAADPATFRLIEVRLLLAVIAVVAHGPLADSRRRSHYGSGCPHRRPGLHGVVRFEAVRGELHLCERRGGRNRRRRGAHGGGGVLVRRRRPHKAVFALK